MRVEPFNPATLEARTVTERRMRLATLVLVLTAPAVLLMADLHWRTGFDAWKVIHLVLFTILFAQLAFGAAQAWTGFWLRRKGGDPLRITATLDPRDAGVLPARTAVIMPICNEEVGRVTEGMRVIYESVRADGKLANCDFFILSDSPDLNHWIEEEAAWLALVQKLDAHGRLFYRKRRGGINKKAGNVADFCRRWGRHYQYMVVLDADSIITGRAVSTLVRLMERNPSVGLIQAVPGLVNGETILARVQQFAGRLYGTVFATGLNYWQLGEANYWGHNAIIRVQPFIRHCSLPELPGGGPFGGRILSHDYVEAALMRRAGWQVWLATDLPGNYEECPANLVDFAKRDRRWLQGNLQHTRLIVARGFHAVNRLHFVLGIFAYVASPLWFALLMVSCVVAWRAHGAPHPELAARALPWSFTTQAMTLLALTLVLLFAPKVITLLDLRRRPDEAAGYGGWGSLIASVVAETITFTFIAPILMLFHTKFVILTLCRRTISWGSQRRGRAGASAWHEAVAAHGGQMAFGAALAFVVWRISPSLAAWMAPLLAGMLLAIPISYLTGSVAFGQKIRRWGLFATPEERAPGPELADLSGAVEQLEAAKAAADDPSHRGILESVLDPFVNAAHASLLRAKDEPSLATGLRLADLRRRLMREGPEGLTNEERRAVLSDVDSMVQLHETVWATPAAQLAPWWRMALARYQSLAPVPVTALTRAA